MAIPAVIQQQIEQAEAIQQQVYAEQSEPAPEVAPPDPEDIVAELPSNVVELPRTAEPAQAETPKPPADDAAYWKQRFSTVQGVLDAEVPRLTQQAREQTKQIQELLKKLEEREAEPVRDAQVTSKDDEEFGADLVAMVRRTSTEVGKHVVDMALAEFRKEFGAVREQVGAVSDRVAQTASERFWGEVETLVPDWKQLDADPRWIDFLDTTPDFSESTYRQLASDAIQKGNAQKIARLVATWKTTFGVPPQAQPRPDPQAELQRQVAPNTAKTGTSVPIGGKIWSKGEYEQAMDVRNVQRYGPVEAARLEADANQAVADGRVRW